MNDQPREGDLCWTPFEPHGLFRIVTIFPPSDRWEASALGFFESAHIRGIHIGMTGRYPLAELRVAHESYLTEA